MPKKLLELIPSKGLSSGLFPSASATSGVVWRDGLNVWFKELGIEMVLGRQKIVDSIAGGPKALAQAFVDGKNRVYYEDGANIYYWDGTAKFPIDSLAPSGSYWMEPFGNFLLLTDNFSQPRIWRNTGSFVNIGVGQFSRAKILKKLREHVLAYSTDVYPSGVHWSDTSNPEQWTPGLAEGSRANFLPFRDLDSEIMAVADLGAAHAVYSKEAMQVLQFIGGDEVFGRPTQGLQGIGAVGMRSIVAVDRYNFGISKGGVFMTDGTSSVYLDRPAVDTFLQENVNWALGEQVIGYHDERLKMIIWSLPMLSGAKVGLGIDAARNLSEVSKQVTFLDGNFSAAAERVVFNNPLLGMADGVYYASVPGLLMGALILKSQLYSPDESRFTCWDYLQLVGDIRSGQIRFGFTDQPNLATLEWTAWLDLTPNIPIPMRESVYIALELQTLEKIEINKLVLYGEMAGRVM